jgi:lipopolysaccharide export system protein LptC
MTEHRSGGGAMAEPLGSKPPQRPRFDYGARSRTTIGEAERYTKFVGLMKRVLFGAALLLLGAVIAYSLQPGQQQKMTMIFEKMGMVAGDLTMLKPKLNGMDSEGNPFVVTADTATQNPKNLRQAKLKNVDADVNLKSGRWLNMTAPYGWLDSDAKTLKVWGAVAVFTDDGDELHTDLAYVDLVHGTVVGPHHVAGQGPQGTYEADHFRIERLSDPCDRPAKAGQHAVKPKHPNRPSPTICPAAAPGAVVAKSKPLIYLLGHVHMVMYHLSQTHKNQQNQNSQNKKSKT